ncbi:MAG: MTAP family purine nucleoside phosphorylase [Phycisphaerae bacterium]|jgi:5'-methylthioadenosine phosphorylase
MGITLACIGGRAAYNLVTRGAFVGERLGPRETPYGESQPIYRCRSEAGEFLLVCRHGEAGYEVAPGHINYQANIYALKDLDVQAIISWSETRAISRNLTIGQYVIVDDLIDETVSRPRSFFDNKELGHIRNWPVFCPTLRRAFTAALTEEGCKFVDRGIYICIEGPRQETPAEARKYASYGGDLIGQTLAPEVFLARELQMSYASLCFVACYAETGTPYLAFESGRVMSESMLLKRAEAAVEPLPAIIHRVHETLHRQPDLIASEGTLQIPPPHDGRNGNWREWFENGSSPQNSAASA